MVLKSPAQLQAAMVTGALVVGAAAVLKELPPEHCPQLLFDFEIVIETSNSKQEILIYNSFNR